MNDEKGLALFALSILRGYKTLKRNPLYATDEIEWLSERWGCVSFSELEEKLKAYV